MKITKKHIIIAYSMALCAGMGALGVYLPNKKVIDNAENIERAYEIEEFLAEKKVPAKELDKTELANKYLEMRYDKYTFIYNSDYNVEQIINTHPTALGSGFEVETKGSKAFFSVVHSGSWAEEQGLETGDEIIAVDGMTIEENGLEVLKKLGGKPDTECRITVSRDEKEITVNFVRHNSETNVLENISSEMLGDTLYIKIDSEHEFMLEKFREIIAENTFDSVILDLRNNRGGDTEMGVGVADTFARQGTVKMIKYSGETEEYTLNDDGNEIEVPVAVLVNGNTASSAEIITSLLKQYANATVIGTNTFGKGIFQIEDVYKDNRFRYTAGYFTVGDWDCWQGKGIAPDIEVEMEYDESIIGTDEDIQLQKALEILNN